LGYTGRCYATGTQFEKEEHQIINGKAAWQWARPVPHNACGPYYHLNLPAQEGNTMKARKDLSTNPRQKKPILQISKEEKTQLTIKLRTFMDALTQKERLILLVGGVFDFSLLEPRIGGAFDTPDSEGSLSHMHSRTIRVVEPDGSYREEKVPPGYYAEKWGGIWIWVQE
jgi:hypothetical protein